jgi:hypothetical protein
VSDFVTELRSEVLDAHRRQAERATRRRLAPRLRPRAWRPAPVMAAIAVAAGVLGIAVAARFLESPDPPPARLKVIAVVPVGGTPVDGALAAGSLWVADFTGRVVRVDPATRRVTARIEFDGNPGSIAGDRDAVWVLAEDRGGPSTHLYRIDPAENRIGSGRFSKAGYGSPPDGGIAVGAGAVWSVRWSHDPAGIERVDPATEEVTLRIRLDNPASVAVGDGVLWAITTDGTLTRFDAGSGRVLERVPELAPSHVNRGVIRTLAADGGAVWALGVDSRQILRVEEGRVTKRFPVAESPQPLLARTRAGLWYATGDELRGRNRLWRLDPDTGHVTGTVDLGDHRPQALVPAGDSLSVVSATGSVLFIGS